MTCNYNCIHVRSCLLLQLHVKRYYKCILLFYKMPSYTGVYWSTLRYTDYLQLFLALIILTRPLCKESVRIRLSEQLTTWRFFARLMSSSVTSFPRMLRLKNINNSGSVEGRVVVIWFSLKSSIWSVCILLISSGIDLHTILIKLIIIIIMTILYSW